MTRGTRFGSIVFGLLMIVGGRQSADAFELTGASRSPVIYDWRTSEPTGQVRASDLGQRVVIELNVGERSAQLPVERLGLNPNTQRGGTPTLRTASIVCDVARADADALMEERLRVARGGQNESLRLTENSGALISSSTVVFCRPADRPIRALGYLRVRACLYGVDASVGYYGDVAPTGGRIIFSFVRSDADGSILGLPFEIATREMRATQLYKRGSLSPRLQSHERYVTDDGCPASVPARGNPEISWPLNDVRISRLTFRPTQATSVQSLRGAADGLINDVLPRNVVDVIAAAQSGGDVQAAVPPEWQTALQQQNRP